LVPTECDPARGLQPRQRPLRILPELPLSSLLTPRSMAATLSNRTALLRTIPPLGSREDRCSFNFLLHVCLAGSGEPALDRAELKLAVRPIPLPKSRVCRATDFKRWRPHALDLSQLPVTEADSFRRGERHDQGSSTTIRLSPNPRQTRAFGATNTMHAPCHPGRGSQGVHLPGSELGRLN
jgi:hypothetical protein